MMARYPDGLCYLCRRGSACPGETCGRCGTLQPSIHKEKPMDIRSMHDMTLEIAVIEWREASNEYLFKERNPMRLLAAENRLRELAKQLIEARK